METAFPFPDIYAADCPTRQILDRIGDKWTVLIIVLLDRGTMRFSEIQHSIGGISQKMVTQTLRNLERDGLISRKVYPTIPPRVEYALTPLGKTLVGPIAAICTWTEAHFIEVAAAQNNYDSRGTATA